MGFKIEIVKVLLAINFPFFGQTVPEFIATGWHLIFKFS